MSYKYTISFQSRVRNLFIFLLHVYFQSIFLCNIFALFLFKKLLILQLKSLRIY